ncbi:hypothetical protein BH10PSE5_BH10PSE5_22050 [soil metagenome]
MQALKARTSRSGLTTGLGGWPTACALVALTYFLATIVGKLRSRGLYVEDDAYYYLIVAKNLAATGSSTFDQQSLTNGYHPLWLAVLVLQNLTIGPSLLATAILQALLLTGAVFLLLRLAPQEHRVVQVGFTGVFALLIGSIGMNGMEVALWTFCLAGLLTVTIWAERDTTRGAWVGVAAAACIGARIDSVLFVVPFVLAAPIGRSAKVSALAGLAALGLLYAVYNFASFGVVMPISSTIKSLGGLQINHLMLAQLAPLDPRQHARLYVITLMALLASPGLIPLSKPGTMGRALAIASTMGGALYLIKLLFLSSWILWPWYNFAILFPLVAGLLVLPCYIDATVNRLTISLWPIGPSRIGLALAITGLCLLGLLGVAAYRKPFKQDNEFAATNREAVRSYGALLNGARVAMGDRSGSFAASYAGPVVQLEGLVNDGAYLKAVTGDVDPRALLCGRKVRYVISYERDLGAYDNFDVALLRPNLTQFSSGALTVWRGDEVVHMRYRESQSLRVLMAQDRRDLYIWRLRCSDIRGPSA